MWTQDMFGVEKPIIALLHLDALPGDPGYCGDMKTVTEHARKDLLALQDGGVDGIFFANEFSLPYQPVADIAVVSAIEFKQFQYRRKQIEAKKIKSNKIKQKK